MVTGRTWKLILHDRAQLGIVAFETLRSDGHWQNVEIDTS